MDERDRYIDRLMRADARENDYETNRKTAKDKHHGNTRIAYGLCAKYNIKLPNDATPKQAWDALEKIGVFADDAYEYLEENETIKGFKPDKDKVTDDDEEEIVRKIKEKLKEYDFQNEDEIIARVLKKARRKGDSPEDVLKNMDEYFDEPLKDEVLRLIRKEHGDKAAEDVKELLAYLDKHASQSGEFYKKIGCVNAELQGLSVSDFRGELNEWKYHNKMISKEQYDFENSHTELDYDDWGDSYWKDELDDNEDTIKEAVDELEDTLDKDGDGYPPDEFYKDLYKFYDECGYDPGEKNKDKLFVGVAECAEKIKEFAARMRAKYLHKNKKK